jgi:hypothetical protein
MQRLILEERLASLPKIKRDVGKNEGYTQWIERSFPKYRNALDQSGPG